jgi:asparagine synthase (glutamine-hydrolysing)
MCGIVGLIDSRAQVDPRVISAAARTLYKRGPDDFGVWTSDNVGLGHRRLAIIDVTSSGHQPMMSPDGRYVLVFNGEIYNFMEIRRQLDTYGFHWRSSSDSEVILAAYAQWGPQCLQRFRGMFAFAIWDCENRTLFLARDRMGVKPLYYHHSAASFAFASRPKALLSLNPAWSSSLDEQAMRFYLECGYVPAPYSIFQAIRKLPPAHWMLVNQSGLRLQQYWDFRGIPPRSDWQNRREDDLLDELEELLTRSITARMISDVSLGAFLSGGIDSSVVVALMAKHSTTRIKTFTVGFAEKSFDESNYAEAVSMHLGTEHYCEHLKISDLLELMPVFSTEFDEPLYDSSAFPTMAVSRSARRYVTVALSGDGGDELFGGYPQYRIVRRLESFYRLPRAMRRALAAIAAKMPQHRLKLLSRALGQNGVMDAFSFCRTVSKDFDGVLLHDLLRRTVSLRDLFSQAAASFPAGLSATESAMRLDALYTLPDDYLQKVDVASMAFSLESRDPLLDHDLVEWAMKLPLKWKLRGRQNKFLLRRLAYRYIPKAILDRPKKGFEVPIHEWLKGPLRTWAEARLAHEGFPSAIPMDRTALLSIFNLHTSGRRNAHPLLWSVLMLVNFMGRPTVNGEGLTPAHFQYAD